MAHAVSTKNSSAALVNGNQSNKPAYGAKLAASVATLAGCIFLDRALAYFVPSTKCDSSSSSCSAIKSVVYTTAVLGAAYVSNPKSKEEQEVEQIAIVRNFIAKGDFKAAFYAHNQISLCKDEFVKIISKKNRELLCLDIADLCIEKNALPEAFVAIFQLTRLTQRALRTALWTKLGTAFLKAQNPVDAERCFQHIAWGNEYSHDLAVGVIKMHLANKRNLDAANVIRTIGQSCELNPEESRAIALLARSLAHEYAMKGDIINAVAMARLVCYKGAPESHLLAELAFQCYKNKQSSELNYVLGTIVVSV
jgi:hypothetical protein